MFNSLDTKSPEETFRKLCEMDFDNLALERAIDFLGMLIDLSRDLLNSDGLDLAEAWAKKLFDKKINSEQRATLNYFYANLWANRRLIKTAQQDEPGDPQWNWNQEEFEKEILFLRLALNEEAFPNLSSTRKCQILTNLANAYSTIGRFIGALEFWDRALQIQSNFGVALGNRGIGRIHYGEILYTFRYHELFFTNAHEDLEAALKTELHPSHRLKYTQYAKMAEQLIHAHSGIKNPILVQDAVTSNETEAYKMWCLKYRLFLNPLNDLFPAELVQRGVNTPTDLPIDNY